MTMEPTKREKEQQKKNTTTIRAFVFKLLNLYV